MDPKARALSEVRLFHRLALLALLGFAFYYAQLLFGYFQSPLALKSLAILFLLVALPLPVIALNNRKVFPNVRGAQKTVLNIGVVLLLCHHFLMTFVFVMIMKGGASF